jgi:hypothetical protein
LLLSTATAMPAITMRLLWVVAPPLSVSRKRHG